MTDITLPYQLLFLLLFISGTATYICGIFFGSLLMRFYVFVVAFMQGFNKKQ